MGVALELRTGGTRTHKLTVDLNSGAGELYELVADPGEMSNLFDDADAQDIRTLLEGYIASRPRDTTPDRVPPAPPKTPVPTTAERQSVRAPTVPHRRRPLTRQTARRARSIRWRNARICRNWSSKPVLRAGKSAR